MAGQIQLEDAEVPPGRRPDAFSTAKNDSRPDTGPVHAPNGGLTGPKGVFRAGNARLLESWRAILRTRELTADELAKLKADGFELCSRKLCDKGKVYKPKQRHNQKFCSPQCRKLDWWETHFVRVKP